VALTTFGTLRSGELISVAHALLGLLGGAHSVKHVDRLLGDGIKQQISTSLLHRR
jgi:hypothetical protein